MSRHSDRRIPIRIANPLDSRTVTSLFHAKRYVLLGLADWDGPDIKFRRCQSDHRELSAEYSVGYDCASSSGMARLRELIGLPAVQPGKLLNFGRIKGATRATFANPYV